MRAILFVVCLCMAIAGAALGLALVFAPLWAPGRVTEGVHLLAVLAFLPLALSAVCACFAFDLYRKD